jgi:hypothetical protein
MATLTASTKTDIAKFASGGGMRANVDELLKNKKESIEKLKTLVDDKLFALDAQQYDDIFLLRYVLTHGDNFEKAADCVKQTILWRKENHEKIINAVKTGFGPKHEIAVRFNTVGHAGSLPAPGNEPIYVVRTGYCDIKGLMNTMTHEEVVDWLHFTKEKVWRECDSKTRETRLLTKEISVIDMANFSLFGGDSRFYKCLGEASKLSAIYYPQLLGKTVLINTPSYFRILYKTFSIFMPQSALDKQVLCPAKDTEKEDVSKCPFMKRFNAIGNVPDFLGGALECPPSLIPISKRDDKMEQIVVGSRRDNSIEMEIPLACELVWNVQVEAYGIVLNAKFINKSNSKETVLMPEPLKIKAEDGLQIYKFSIKEAGKVIFVYDNHHSRFRGKSINYRVDVNVLEEE